jgi:hypothetical protein
MLHYGIVQKKLHVFPFSCHGFVIVRQMVFDVFRPQKNIVSTADTGPENTNTSPIASSAYSVLREVVSIKLMLFR